MHPASALDSDPSNRERCLVVGGIRTRCLLSGDGAAAVLFLHGWGGSADSWTPITSRLRHRDVRTIAVDLPGSGKAEGPDRPWTIDDFAGWVVSLLEKLEENTVVLVGRSFGGRVAARVTATRPDLVSKLVLIASAGLPRRGGKIGLLRKVSAAGRSALLMVGLRSLVDRIRPAYWRLIGATDYATAGPRRETMRLSVGVDQSADFAAIQRPTLLIWGDLDDQTPLSHGQALAGLIKGAELRVIRGAGHHVQLDEPGTVSELISAFLTLSESKLG